MTAGPHGTIRIPNPAGRERKRRYAVPKTKYRRYPEKRTDPTKRYRN